MDASLERQTERVGSQVRRRRLQRRWTLDVAAARLGVSRRLLTQVEAGQANPSLSTLLLIAAGFNMSLVELISGGDQCTITVQTDNASAPIFWTGTHGGEARLLVGSEPLELWHWSLEPGDERVSNAHRANSREAVLVCEGAVALTIGAAEPVTVVAGQSALFRADEPHTYSNITNKRAQFVLAVHETSGASS